MSLIRWFRRYNRKIMAIVVVVIMFGFIGGSYFRYLGRRRGGLHKPVAYFGDNEKITNYDLALARQELETLRLIRADTLLRRLNIPLLSMPDLRPLLLAEVLFAQPTISPTISRRIKQLAIARQYPISDRQIDDIYKRSFPTDVYWLLLKREAQQAGIAFSKEEAGEQLGRVIPSLFDGMMYSQLIGGLVKQRGIAEEEILEPFSELLAVLEYARLVCSNEDVTTPQIIHVASWENETIDVNLVRFDSAVFADAQATPTQQELTEHFEKYKRYFAGELSEENPYGFGYKQPDRVQLEYIAVVLDDVAATVSPPTQQETEEYYQRYAKYFTEQLPQDPNDPNSPMVERTKRYAEVADEISEQLFRMRTNSKAERILQQARVLTESGLEKAEVEPEELSSEDFGRLAGDYASAAEQLKQEYKVDLYVGRTGLLSAAEIRSDQYLSRLYLASPGYKPAELSKIVFAVDEIGSSELGPFDVPKPRLYENIGPLKDVLSQMAFAEPSGQIMAIVRVIKAQKASEPESIDQSFSKQTLRIGGLQAEGAEEIYSVADEVSEDLKKLAAMETAKVTAEKFIKSAAKKDWQKTVDKFNKRYGRSSKKEEGQPGEFEFEELKDLRIVPNRALNTLAVQEQGDPARQPILNGVEKQSQFIDRLCSLVPQDQETVETLPLVMEFKPDMSYYCIEDILVRRLEQSEYERVKSMVAWKEDTAQSQSLAVVHFNPENILKRMNFRLLKEEGQADDANTPAEAHGVSL
jgi:hypothetical protein